VRFPKYLIPLTLLGLMVIITNCSSPLKQITAFVVAVPCGAVHMGATCYEITYSMMEETDELSDQTKTRKDIRR
jgi:hypothetical protein